MRRLVLTGLAVAGLTAPAAAQRAQQLELAVFGSYTRFDRRLGFENQFGAGGRLGFFLTDHVSVEVDGSYVQPRYINGGPSATLALGSGSLVLNFGNEKNLFYILGGYSRFAFIKAAPHFNDNAGHFGIGDRIFFERRVALRAEVRGAYSLHSHSAGANGEPAIHVSGSLGLSFFLAGRPPRDTDTDGVPDRIDTCTATPARATVDTIGCPSDADRDGVFNGLDSCPNTPAGAQTDRTGCPTDEDKDRVPDGLDQCSATPAAAVVDSRGCPSDADGDRVPDGIDQCPNTEFEMRVDATGCPVDSDGDGVPEAADRCPATPPGSDVDPLGCPRIKDTDGDGVQDPQDRCPATATGTHVDGSGCPVLFTPERTAVVLRGVNFESGLATLRPESFAVLDQVAASLVANPDIRIEIGGHTDNTGNPATNLQLSQQRAITVQQYLASKGVSRFHMAARGYGSTRPVATNATPAGRGQNRRVELRRIN
jgi:outer membrane protein OmpA-like peptidoglycan-associated protein